MATYRLSLKLSKYNKQDMQNTAREARMKSVMFSCGPLHMNVLVLDKQEQHIYNSSVWTQDVV